MNVAGISDSLAGVALVPEHCPVCQSTVRIRGGECLNCLLNAGKEEENDELAGKDFADLLVEIDLPDSDWRLGNYQILEEIGRGGMGVIYRARQRHSRRIVALKRVLSYHGDSRETLERFRREAEAAASLDHPNILPIYEVGEADGLPYFTMKYATGGTLQQAAPVLKSDTRECVRLLSKVARAVAHAHREGILHRDLKPGNVLLDALGEPMVSDFGLAKWIETDSNLTRSLAIFGTPGFIAPEQASGSRGSLTPAADIYSLGAILFDLLTGRPPFLAEHALAVINLARDHAAPKLRSLDRSADRDLETICAKCLEREPQARYRAASALAEDLERWLEGRPIIARPVSPIIRVWRWSKRNPQLSATAVFCAIAISLGLMRQLENRHLGESLREEQLASYSLLLLPVLDLEMVSTDSALANEMTSRLLSACGVVETMKIASLPQERMKEAAFKWKDMDLRRSALSAGAKAFLLATVRRVEGRPRLSLTLVDSGSGRVLDRRITVDEPFNPESMRQNAIALGEQWRANARRENLPRLRSDAAGATQSETAKNYLLAGDDLTRKRNEENFDRGVECYRKALAAEPDCALAHASLASALGMRLQFRSNPLELRESLDLAHRAVALDPLLPEAHRAEAVALTMAGDFPAAVEASLRAFELDPTYQRAPGLLGALADLMGRPDVALRWFRWATRLQTQPGEYSSNIASALVRLGEDEAAEASLRDGMEFRPELPDATFSLIELRLVQQRFAEASALADQVLRLAPTDRQARENAAEVYLVSGKLSEAERVLRKLVAENGSPDATGSRMTSFSALGWLCLQTGRQTEGNELLAKARGHEAEALETAPSHPAHFYSLAATCAALGEKEVALQYLRKAVESGWLEGRYARVDPRWIPLRSDQEWEKIIKGTENRLAELRRTKTW